MTFLAEASASAPDWRHVPQFRQNAAGGGTSISKFRNGYIYG